MVASVLMFPVVPVALPHQPPTKGAILDVRGQVMLGSGPLFRVSQKG